MKKFFTYASAFALALAMTVSFSSCSDDGDNVDDTKTDQLEAVVSQYTNNVIYPTYTNLANSSQELYDKLVQMKADFDANKLTDEQVKDVCAKFLDARAWWEKSEAFLYGSASDNGIDPHIDSWPLDRSKLADLLSSEDYKKLEGEDGIEYISSLNDESSWLGFHGIEFIIFRNGKERLASDFKKNEDDPAFNGKTVNGEQELTFAIAVAGDLRDHCCWLEASWKGGDAVDAAHLARCTKRGFKLTSGASGMAYGPELLKAQGSDLYKTWRGAIGTILSGGCMNICDEVATQKLGQAWRTVTGNLNPGETESEDYVGKEYIESPYSHKSFTDFYDNIMSIKSSLYGKVDATSPEKNSIISYLKEHNADLASSLETKLANAFSALETCQAGKSFVEVVNSNDKTGLANVKKAMDAISELNDELSVANDWILKN